MISIVPRLAPVVDGVGDYALRLSRQLRTDNGIETRFVIGDPSWTGPSRIEGFQVDCLTERSVATLLEVLQCCKAESLLLHYGGYGYAKRGCPTWLINGVERWRNADHGRVLLTLFHELFASGPPWTSSFWLSSRQKHLTARLARMSSQCLTSSERYAARLAGFSANNCISSQSLPVFSNVGEPDSHPPPLLNRRRRLVVFGTRGRRAQVYLRSARELSRICRELQIEEILDIGRRLDFQTAHIVSVPVISCGEMRDREVGNILLDAVAGVLDYWPHLLGKSTIFAAYCAHRLIPIIAAQGTAARADGLEPGKHYYLVDGLNQQLSLSAGQIIADCAYDWYQAHTLAIHAQKLAAYLANLGVMLRGNLADA